MTGWQAGLLSIAFVVGTVIQGLIVLNSPSYVFERWHGTLLVWAIASFCVIFNTLLAKKLPAVEGLVLTIHIMGLFAIVVPLWILSPRATANEALLTFTNGGAWPTLGLSAMIGLLAPVGSMCGFDCVVHMGLYLLSLLSDMDADMDLAEEVEDAGRTIPRSIMWSVWLNGAMGFIMAITMCFCLGDLSEIVETPTGYPFIQVFYNSTKSYAATNIMVTIMIITLVACGVSQLATASRQLWSFARDRGIPFSDWVAYVRLLPANLGYQLTLEQGLTYDAYTSARGSPFLGHYLPRIVDQHWLYCRAQRYCLPCGRCSSNLLLHHHRRCDLETTKGRATATTEMVSW